MIIGLAGAKESGKNTAAKFIADEFGDKYGVGEWSFAAKLKQSAAASLLGKVLPVEEAVQFCDDLKNRVDINVYDESIKDQFTLSGREYLQWYGTEAHREIFGKDFWIDAVMKEIPKDDEIQPTIGWSERLDLITDVRFPNEAEAIQSAGGRVFRLNRSVVMNGEDTHASEIPLPLELVWTEVDNNDTLDDLRKEIVWHTTDAIKVMKHG